MTQKKAADPGTGGAGFGGSAEKRSAPQRYQQFNPRRGK
jgi:hypothetical protein